MFLLSWQTTIAPFVISKGLYSFAPTVTINNFLFIFWSIISSISLAYQ